MFLFSGYTIKIGMLYMIYSYIKVSAIQALVLDERIYTGSFSETDFSNYAA